MSERTITLSRTFNAPVAAVYRLWTEARYMRQWWGIEGSTAPVCELDVRPGGAWRIDMRTESGAVYRNSGTYLEVEPHEKLVFTSDPDPETSEWQGEPPQRSIHTVLFAGQGARTQVKLIIEFATAADRDRMVRFGMPEGIEQGLDRLERLLAATMAEE